MKRISVWVVCLCLCVSVMACGQRSPIPDESVPLPSEEASSVSTTTTASTTTVTDSGDTTEESTTVEDTTESTTATGSSTIGSIDAPSSQRTTGGTTCGLLHDWAQTTTSTTTTTVTTTTTTTTTTVSPTSGTTTAVQVENVTVAQAAYKADMSRVYDGYTNGLTAYYQQVLPQFLTGEAGENRICSPISVYLAMAMLAESAAGDSRQQVLDLLGATDVDSLSRQTAALWNSLYSTKQGAECLLANSLWLNDNYSFGYVDETVRRLSEDYYASVFSGKMGSSAYDARLQKWLNDNTGGLLKEQAMQEKLPANGVALLVNTVYFNATWEKAFDPKKTAEKYFTTASGAILCEFMRASEDFQYYWQTDDYIAINRPMNGGFSMWYILPDKDYPVEQLPSNRDVLGMITETGGPQKILCDLVTTVPKFDFTSRVDLRENLQTLGVTDLFDVQKANMSSLLGQDSYAYITGISHAVRVITKEEGVKAAAYTGITGAMKGTSTTTRVRPLIYFTADRPFMFAVTGADGAVLFTGIIEDPT